jgi:hypothetical protein
LDAQFQKFVVFPLAKKFFMVGIYLDIHLIGNTLIIVAILDRFHLVLTLVMDQKVVEIYQLEILALPTPLYVQMVINKSTVSQ